MKQIRLLTKKTFKKEKATIKKPEAPVTGWQNLPPRFPYFLPNSNCVDPIAISCEPLPEEDSGGQSQDQSDDCFL